MPGPTVIVRMKEDERVPLATRTGGKGARPLCLFAPVVQGRACPERFFDHLL